MRPLYGPAVTFRLTCIAGLAIDHEIVKRHFVNVAGVETGATTSVVFVVIDSCQILTVGVKRQLIAFDSYFQLVWSTAGFNRVGLGCPRPSDDWLPFLCMMI